MRPIRPEEEVLIRHLLQAVAGGNKYVIPTEVENLGEGGLGGIQLATRGNHTNDLIEGEYTDDDGKKVLITLSENEHGELFDLDIWKMDFASLKTYPVPARVALP